MSEIRWEHLHHEDFLIESDGSWCLCSRESESTGGQTRCLCSRESRVHRWWEADLNFMDEETRDWTSYPWRRQRSILWSFGPGHSGPNAFKHVHTLPITKCELYPRKAGPDMIEFSCVHFYGLCLLRTEMKVPFKQMSMGSHEHWMSTVLHGVNWNFIFIIFSQKASVYEDFDIIRIFVGSLDSPHPCSSSPQLLSTLDSHLSPHSLNLLICPFSWAI